MTNSTQRTATGNAPARRLMRELLALACSFRADDSGAGAVAGAVAFPIGIGGMGPVAKTRYTFRASWLWRAVRPSYGGLPKALPFRRLLDDTAGIAAVEFALISPVLLAIVLGMFSFGGAMKDYLVLTRAAGQGALTLALSRGITTPYTTTTTAINAAAPTLTLSSLAVTVTIDGVACTTNSTCSTALVAGRTAVVTSTYPCTLSVMGINYKPGGCTLTASTAQMVQ